ncbi:MAG: YfiM family protein [Spirochaetes bacterium]|jgi:hypothetical protein|nr:YfiM family protein [Spirochaetota bacterium]
MKNGILSASLACVIFIASQADASAGSLYGNPYSGLFVQAEQAPEKKQIDGKETGEQGAGETKKKIVRYSILIGVPVLVYSFALGSWGWADRRSWKWGHEGFFGHGTYEGGLDKTCHMYSQYFTMRAAYTVFNYTENGAPIKWVYAIGFTSLLGLSIEFGDAYSGQNGFAWEDLVANAVGITIGSLLEKYPKADAFVSLSAEYFPTEYFRKRPQHLMMFPDDYSGWSIMANFKLAGFREIGLEIPDFMRYIMLDLGYFCRGYTKYDRRTAAEGLRYPTKSQNWFFGVSINMMEVVKDFFEDKNSFACRAAQQPFKYIHIPAGYKFKYAIRKSIGHPKVRWNNPMNK